MLIKEQYDTTYRTTGELLHKTAYAYVKVCDDGPTNDCKSSAHVDNPKV
jgi:hypothetical protein